MRIDACCLIALVSSLHFETRPFIKIPIKVGFCFNFWHITKILDRQTFSMSSFNLYAYIVVPRLLFFGLHDMSGQTVLAALNEKDAKNMEKKMSQ
jgi:hypothetical protein